MVGMGKEVLLVATLAWISNLQCALAGVSSIAVVTQNLFWSTLFDHHGGGNLFNVFNTCGPYDVMLFNEAKDIAFVIQGLGYSNIQFWTGSKASAIAWNGHRFTFIDKGFGIVAEDRYDQYMEGERPLVWVRLYDTYTRKFFFFATHQGPTPIDSGGKYGGESVANRIADLIQNETQSGDIAVFGGDLNTHFESSTVNQLMVRGLRRIASDNQVHLFVHDLNDELSTSKIKSVFDTGSDHNGLQAKFEVRLDRTPWPTRMPTINSTLMPTPLPSQEPTLWNETWSRQPVSQPTFHQATWQPTHVLTPTLSPQWTEDNFGDDSEVECGSARDIPVTDALGTYSCWARVSSLAQNKNISIRDARRQIATNFSSECEECYFATRSIDEDTSSVVGTLAALGSVSTVFGAVAFNRYRRGAKEPSRLDEVTPSLTENAPVRVFLVKSRANIVDKLAFSRFTLK